MANKTEKLIRRSLRLKEYNYSQPGGYFITICTHHRECLFGEIIDGKMILNNLGKVIQVIWIKLPDRYPLAKVDAFIVMPNHFHAILWIKDVGAIHELPLPGKTEMVRRRNMLLPKVIGYFKMNTAKQINSHLGTPGKPLWQHNYYEHVIRNETDLEEIREYIVNNPAKWLDDENHPDHIKRRGAS